MYYSTILCKALWNIYYIFLRNQDDNYMLSLTMTGLPFHTQIHRNWNFILAFTFSFGISQSHFPLCLNLGEKAGSQNKAEGHLGQHPLSLLAVPGVPASLQAQLHSFHVSLIMHTPPFNYDASKSQNVCCQTEWILTFGILCRVHKNCQLMNYKSKGPIFSSQSISLQHNELIKCLHFLLPKHKSSV